MAHDQFSNDVPELLGTALGYYTHFSYVSKYVLLHCDTHDLPVMKKQNDLQGTILLVYNAN